MRGMTDKPAPKNEPLKPAREWMTEAETAELLNLSVKWLQNKRVHGGGPRFAKFGAAVRYSREDVRSYASECLRSSTSDHGPRKNGEN